MLPASSPCICGARQQLRSQLACCRRPAVVLSGQWGREGSVLQRQATSTFSKRSTGGPNHIPDGICCNEGVPLSVPTGSICGRVTVADGVAVVLTVALQRLDCRPGPSMRHTRLQAPKLLPKVDQPLPVPSSPLRRVAPAATLHIWACRNS